MVSKGSLGYIYSIAWGDPVTTQLGIGPYPQSKTIFPGSSYGMGIHYKSTEEFSLRSTGWDALFAVEGDTGNTYIQGNTGIGITNPTSTLQVQSGDMRLVDGNVIVASGHGIDFSATGGPINSATSQSELLDDFERGYWTPTIFNSTNQPSYTYNAVNGGWYTKVGKLVTVGFNLRATHSMATPSGTWRIDGLPFTVAAQNNSTIGNSAYSAGAIGYANGLKSLPAEAQQLDFCSCLIMTKCKFMLSEEIQHLSH